MPRFVMIADRDEATNLELKASDNTANPYISLGGVMAAALDGIRNGIDPGEGVDQDPGNLSEAEMKRRGIRRFPTTSKEALDELERDEVLMTALGSDLGNEYLKVRRAEAAAYAEQDEAFKAPIREQYESQGHPYYASARLWDDGVIDPAETRTVLALGLSAALNAPIPPTRFGV